MLDVGPQDPQVQYPHTPFHGPSLGATAILRGCPFPGIWKRGRPRRETRGRGDPLPSGGIRWLMGAKQHLELPFALTVTNEWNAWICHSNFCQCCLTRGLSLWILVVSSPCGETAKSRSVEYYQ